MSRGRQNREVGNKKEQCVILCTFILLVLICFHPQGNQGSTHIGLYDLQTKQNEVRAIPGFYLVVMVL